MYLCKYLRDRALTIGFVRRKLSTKEERKTAEKSYDIILFGNKSKTDNACQASVHENRHKAFTSQTKDKYSSEKTQKVMDFFIFPNTNNTFHPNKHY